jgi:hypothetical protein
MRRTLATVAAFVGLLAAAAPASADPDRFVVDGPFTVRCETAPASQLSITIYDALITSYMRDVTCGRRST